MTVKVAIKDECIFGVNIECNVGDLLIISKALRRACMDNGWHKDDVRAMERMLEEIMHFEEVDAQA